MPISLVEILLLAERGLEQRLCGLALLRPKTIAELTIRPEVDQAARAFFERLDQRKEEIAAADGLQAIRIAQSCCTTPLDFFRFFNMVENINTLDEVEKISAELAAMRTARKAVRWVEESGILNGVIRGIHER